MSVVLADIGFRILGYRRLQVCHVEHVGTLEGCQCPPSGQPEAPLNLNLDAEGLVRPTSAMGWLRKLMAVR